MIKYVINSGGLKHQPKLKKEFHQELVKDLNNNTPQFLLCMFAQPREDWNIKFGGYSDSILEDMPEGVTPTFDLAMPATFLEQCKKADIIYFFGGDSHLLHYWMEQYDVPAIFEGKVVATSSAGSQMLAQSFWTCDWRECGDGLGILPIKFIPHYQSNFSPDDPRGPIDWQKAYDDLAAYGDTSLPIHALKEGEYIVMKV
jgi:hypothetical protein